MIGTMNNAGSVLLTIADLSIIQAEVEVDETDIPFITKGQKAKVTIDALPDQTFPGTVTEVGNSPIAVTGHGDARHELQGRGDDRRPRAGRPARVHVHGGDHDGHRARK